MERIVFLDRDSVKAKFKTPTFSHDWIEFPMTQPEQVVERLREATIAITNKVVIDKSVIEQLPNLKMIAVAATGTNCVDTKYCREKGIIVSNVSNYSIHSVPEEVFTLILALMRNLMSYHADIREGKWQKSELFCILDHPIRELNNSTLGIIGYGNLGQAVGKLAQAFGMKVLISEHKSAEKIRDGRVSFDEVLKSSDVITLHCPLTPETADLLGEKEFEAMKPTAILINCGRGGLVNEKALFYALQNNKIGGAGVDVLSTEPPANGNPLLDAELPNLIVMPHIAWASVEAMQVLADILIDNLEAFVKNAPQNVV